MFYILKESRQIGDSLFYKIVNKKAFKLIVNLDLKNSDL
jgi:hypothetical protein